MTRDQQIKCLAAALTLFYSGSAPAATVVETVPSTITFPLNGSVTFGFAPVANADQLVSVSGGSIASSEGLTSFTVTLDYSNASTGQLFNSPFVSSINFQLSSLSNLSFPIGTIDGITFSVAGYDGVGPHSIPAGTNFTFHTTDSVTSGVPEPATWAMMLAGFAGIGYSFRRRRRNDLAKAS